VPELLAAEPALFVGLALLLGLMVGSFLNVVIHRLPRMIERDWRAQCAYVEGREIAEEPAYTLIRPRSACPACGHLIRWYENIPVLSWLMLKGRCAHCGTSITARYPLVEILTAILFSYAAWRWGYGAHTVAVCILLAALIALTFIDLDTQLLPDSITLPLLWIGLLVNLHGLFVPLDQAVIGAVAGYLALWSIYHLFKWLTGKEGMGFGDFKLLAALGAWLGWQMLLPIVLAASLVGALVGVALVLSGRHQAARPLPFGPWLALGGLLALFWGETLLEIWLG